MIFSSQTIFSQEISLDDIKQLSKKNYSLFKKKEILKEKESLERKIINSSFLPKFGVNGKATYQSDVPTLPSNFPNSLPTLQDRDQYNFSIDINQLIYDGGKAKIQKKIVRQTFLVDDLTNQLVEDQFNQIIDIIFLNIILIKKKIELQNELNGYLKVQEKTIHEQINGGVNYKGNLYLIQSEMLKNEQLIIELRSELFKSLAALKEYSGYDLYENSEFIIPEVDIDDKIVSNRKELEILKLKVVLVDQKIKQYNTEKLPRFFFFYTFGYGRPSLNFLKNEFDTYYIGGAKLTWNIESFYNLINNLRQQNLEKESIKVQEEMLKSRIIIEQNEKKLEIEKVKSLLQLDREFVVNKNRLKLISDSQLKEGIITFGEHLKSVLDLYNSRNTLLQREISLVKCKLEYKSTYGY